MDTLIRAAGAADYAAIEALFAEGDAFHATGAPFAFRPPVPPVRSREYVAGILADERQALLVAEHAGQLAGYIHVQTHEWPQSTVIQPRRFAVIDSIVVRSTSRGAGIGSALMRHAEEWARERGLGEIELTVWEFPGSAIPFYDGLGYSTMTRRMRKVL